MKLNFLQSTKWEEFQKSQGKKTFRLKGDDFETFAILDHTPLGDYLFCPYGPVLKNKNALESAIKALKTLAQQQKVIFIRLEPQMYFAPNYMQKIGAKKVHDIEPAATWILDLTSPQEEILKGIEKEKTRLWRNSNKKGITFRKSTDANDTKILNSLLSQVAQKNDFTPHKNKYLTDQVKSGVASLFIVELAQDNEKAPIAASMVYDDEDTRYYIHAAADYAHRKLGAGSSIIIEEILDAKNKGLKYFDFWGITTSTDKNHPWYGFTQFKKSYGGVEKIFSGTYDIPVNKIKYRLYSLLRPLNKLRKK
ncbi:peptidoglycan bridge formation glycyltransferase FemA/FemB family protein [Candidatus Saccharibacteria bacterium]|nr:peptidoglycan bridge formation glycyltransferase FemA/FemB family protein [Candidatus Saccharibacteria bacterium]